jgi:hypothetical protein
VTVLVSVAFRDRSPHEPTGDLVGADDRDDAVRAGAHESMRSALVGTFGPIGAHVGIHTVCVMPTAVDRRREPPPHEHQEPK